MSRKIAIALTIVVLTMLVSASSVFAGMPALDASAVVSVDGMPALDASAVVSVDGGNDLTPDAPGHLVGGR